jgi:hypothetical protein
VSCPGSCAVRPDLDRIHPQLLGQPSHRHRRRSRQPIRHEPQPRQRAQRDRQPQPIRRTTTRPGSTNARSAAVNVKNRNSSSRLISGKPRRRSNSSSANTRVATNPNLRYTRQHRRQTSQAPSAPLCLSNAKTRAYQRTTPIRPIFGGYYGDPLWRLEGHRPRRRRLPGCSGQRAAAQQQPRSMDRTGPYRCAPDRWAVEKPRRGRDRPARPLHRHAGPRRRSPWTSSPPQLKTPPSAPGRGATRPGTRWNLSVRSGWIPDRGRGPAPFGPTVEGGPSSCGFGAFRPGQDRTDSLHSASRTPARPTEYQPRWPVWSSQGRGKGSGKITALAHAGIRTRRRGLCPFVDSGTGSGAALPKAAPGSRSGVRGVAPGAFGDSGCPEPGRSCRTHGSYFGDGV